MEIFTPVQNHHITEKSYKQLDTQIKGWYSTDIQSTRAENQINLKAKDLVPASKVLSSTEMVTLKVLFGFEKPEELMFYGQSKTHQIHKGRFLDLIG